MLYKKINKLLVGTNNRGKLREIRELLPKHVKIKSTYDFKLKSPKENGNTFKKNAFLKSKYYSKKTQLVCLSDDSGLEIDLLDKKPGIYSARWAGKAGDFSRAIKKVFRELEKKDKNWKTKNIKARFICALSICYLNKEIASSIGKVEGYISKIPKGKNGFGYDPIFIAKNKKKTFGELRPSVKFRIDHRYVAFKKIKKFF